MAAAAAAGIRPSSAWARDRAASKSIIAWTTERSSKIAITSGVERKLSNTRDMGTFRRLEVPMLARCLCACRV